MKPPALFASMTFGWMAMLTGANVAHPGDTPAAAAAPAAALPAHYATSLRRVGDALFDEKSGVTTVFVNELAGSVTGFSQERYPDGSVIVMEFAQPQRDGEGELMRDARGQPLKGKIDYLAVMRRIAGFGAIYADERAGEWEFSTYRPDGSALITPDKAVHCASCHRKAGSDRDFVYRIRTWSAP
ncbi:MAG: cytochrome P460 family protein [Fibrobacteres bacterium]|nr:cytochrome P460 family protein [Fibrobacterota bacterium]